MAGEKVVLMNKYNNLIDEEVIKKASIVWDGKNYVYKHENQPTSSSAGPSTSNIVTNEMLMEKLCVLTNKVDSIINGFVIIKKREFVKKCFSMHFSFDEDIMYQRRRKRILEGL